MTWKDGASITFNVVFKPAMDEVCQLREQIKNIWTRELKQSYLSLSLAKRTEPGYPTAVRRALAEGLFTRTAVVTDLAVTDLLSDVLSPDVEGRILTSSSQIEPADS